MARGALVAAAAVLSMTAAAADPLADGAKAYKPFAVEHIGIALAGAKDLQAAAKAGDVKAAQAAWIKSRKGWEAVEPITGEFFPELDGSIDAWPDAKQGYHAIEAALFAGKVAEIAAPADKLVADLAAFDKQLRAPNFRFTPQGLLNGAAKLAYEVGENKSKGGESPYAGTSLIDMRENVEGIEAVFKLAFEPALAKRDRKLAAAIDEKIEDVEKLVKADDLKNIDQGALRRTAEELAVLLQSAAPKLGLKKPAVGG
jgi:iron uptake system EfeUOB component EfeO/EfeM